MSGNMNTGDPCPKYVWPGVSYREQYRALAQAYEGFSAGHECYARHTFTNGAQTRTGTFYADENTPVPEGLLSAETHAYPQAQREEWEREYV